MSTPKQAATHRGQRSRQTIIMSCRHFLVEQDLNTLTLDQIAERSGIAKSSILWHFGSKSGLLLAVVEQILEQTRCLIDQLDTEGLNRKQRLQALLSALANDFVDSPEANALLITFIVQRNTEPDIRRQIKGLYDGYRLFIEQILQAESIRLTRYQSAVVLAFIDGAFIQWYLQPEEIKLELLLTAVVDMLDIA